jgi:hypothetical protein
MFKSVSGFFKFLLGSKLGWVVLGVSAVVALIVFSDLLVHTFGA